MPEDHGFWFDNDQGVPPFFPYFLEKHPEYSVLSPNPWVASVYGDKWRAVVEGQDSQKPDLIVSWTA